MFSQKQVAEFKEVIYQTLKKAKKNKKYFWSSYSKLEYAKALNKYYYKYVPIVT